MYPAPYSIENFTGLIIFEISGSDYCLNNIIVSSILKPPFKLHGSAAVRPDFTYIYGEESSMPLVDMQKIITGNPAKTDGNSRIIIIDYNEEQFGLLVGRIKEIVALDAKYITTSMQFTPKADCRQDLPSGNYIDGTLEFEGRTLLLPSLEKIIKECGSL